MPNALHASIADPRTFVDTNVLVYAYDASESAKQPTAAAVLDRLWRTRTGVISTQVLQEFYSVATTKRRPPLSLREARDVVDIYAAWPVTTLDPTIILAAARLQERHRLSFWDALIVEAARVAGATTILTEDLTHDSTIDGLRIVNPFLRGESA